MPFTFTMPKLSPTMEEGTIVKWHKQVGDYVKTGETLIEVATDKATVEHSVIDSGWLKQILIKEGQAAIVNQPIAIFTEEKDENIEGYQPEGAMPAKKVEASIVGEGAIKETSQVIASTQAGLRLPAFVPEPPLSDYEFEFPRDEIQERVPASPLARRLAKEKGLDITTVKGTGPNERVMSTDLAMAQPDSVVAFNRRALPGEQPGTFEEEALSPIRKIIGQRLQESKTFIPHFYVTVQIDAGALVEMREQLIRQEVKLSYNDLIIRASALALKKHPEINSGFNTVNNTIIRFKTIDIAVAVSTPSGLLTPIIRHADFKNVGEISAEVKRLAGLAKVGKLQAHEYKGGSFTISNLGMFGVSEFIAVINPPQAAILAVGGILQQPIVRNGQVVAGHVMSLTVSADHRVVDGTFVAQFLNTLKKLLESPSILLI